jgi:hypothetical protein
MTPWLLASLVSLAVILGILVLVWLGAKLIESHSAQWEEDQIRRIAADGAELSRSAPCGSVDGVAPGPHHQPPDDGEAASGKVPYPEGPPFDDPHLPDNWRELDGKGSFEEAWDAMRCRTGGA